MDPDQTLQDIIAAAYAGDGDALTTHADNLAEWMERGGFAPTWRVCGSNCNLHCQPPTAVLATLPGPVTLDEITAELRERGMGGTDGPTIQDLGGNIVGIVIPQPSGRETYITSDDGWTIGLDDGSAWVDLPLTTTAAGIADVVVAFLAQ